MQTRGTWHTATGLAQLAMVFGHIDDIDDSSAFHRAAALMVNLLLSNGFVFVESKGVMVGEVGACDGCGLGVDLCVQALELARMTLKCVIVGGDRGSVLVLHNAKFERMLLAHA